MLRVPETDEIILGENLDVLAGFADETFQMIYIDPPFNTGKEQLRKALLPHRLPRGALLQDLAGRDLWPRELPQRDHLGLRLWGSFEGPLASEARHRPRLREGHAGLPLSFGRSRSRTVYGTRPCDA